MKTYSRQHYISYKTHLLVYMSGYFWLVHGKRNYVNKKKTFLLSTKKQRHLTWGTLQSYVYGVYREMTVKKLSVVKAMT